MVISKEKRKINKDLLFNDAKKLLKTRRKYKDAISDVIKACYDRQPFVREEIQVVGFPYRRNEYPIDELEYDGHLYPFSKTRLTIEPKQDPHIQYLFEGGKEDLESLDPLVEEFIELLQEDEEIAEYLEARRLGV
nr:hypothetical protein [Neobacillus sp. 179.-C4.2 HS]